jgi:hypothetical protein
MLLNRFAAVVLSKTLEDNDFKQNLLNDLWSMEEIQ